MRIINLRLGFATNSSSTHSIIITQKKYDDVDSETGGFGWDNFVLSSTSSKMAYLASMVKDELSLHIDESMARLASAALFGVSTGSVGYVDHQSRYDLPTISYYGKIGINVEFMHDLARFVERGDVVIIGGNDNDEQSNEILDIIGDGEVFTKLNRIKDEGCSMRARKDGKFWTLFNTKTGAKMTFSFEDDAVPPAKSFLPELVDIAITHQCSSGCSYCYTDATPTGAIASFDKVQSLLYNLASARVFEVALGGGDVISHPNLVEILRLCRNLDIVPNITCKSVSWIREKPEILSLVGQIGVSNEYPERVRSFMDVYTEANLSAHYVMGIDSLTNLKEKLIEANRLDVPVVLLGFKQVGRGKGYRHLKDYSTWGEMIVGLGYKCPTLAIDTLLAQQYPEQTAMVAQSNILYRTADGTNSMYVDLVDGYVAPSSWCNENERIKLGEDNKNLFASWSGKTDSYFDRTQEW